jgi:hypothetical protein
VVLTVSVAVTGALPVVAGGAVTEHVGASAAPMGPPETAQLSATLPVKPPDGQAGQGHQARHTIASAQGNKTSGAGRLGPPTVGRKRISPFFQLKRIFLLPLSN